MSYQPNDKIGPYRLLRPLGAGGFGAVWLAEKRTALTTTQVAIKIPHPTNLDFEAVAREADTWVRASGHPNVLPIIEADIYDGQLVIVSEYAADGTLGDLLDRVQKPFNTEQALYLITGIVQGLQFLHERGIIHRDLKPTNILFQRDIPRIADFGISRLTDQQSSSGIAGTFAYMAPEAFEGIRNAQTDIWAAGLILYEILALKHPFSEPDLPSLIRAITSDEPIPYLPSHSSFALQGIMRKALERNPLKRFKSADEMLAELRSDVVRFEMIIRPSTPEAVAKPNADVVFPAPDDYLEKPRIQHYSFTRDYLRNRAFAIPKPFVDDLVGKSGKKKLQFYWGVNAREMATDEPYIPPTGLDAFAIFKEGHYDGVIITLPRPIGYVEAFFVSVVLVFTQSPDQDEYELRYFTLDLGKSENGQFRTVLSEWGADGHIYSEIHPVSDITEFWELVEQYLPNYSDTETGPDGLTYPFRRDFTYTFRDAPPLGPYEHLEIRDSLNEWNDDDSKVFAVFPSDKGFVLAVFSKYWVPRRFGTKVFKYLVDTYLRRRGGGYSYI